MRGAASTLLAVAVPAAALGALLAIGLDLPGRIADRSPDGPLRAASDRQAAGPATARGRALARRAASLVAVDPPALGYRLALAGPRPKVRAETDRAARTITLFLREDDVAHRVAHDLAHEIGHAYDDRRLDDGDRAAWLRDRGARGVPWFPDGRLADYDTGAGDFAEVFALCHAASPEFRSTVAPAPAPADACSALPREARSAMLAPRKEQR